MPTGSRRSNSTPNETVNSRRPSARLVKQACPKPISNGSLPMLKKAIPISCFMNTTRTGTAEPIKRCPDKTPITAFACPTDFFRRYGKTANGTSPVGRTEPWPKHSRPRICGIASVGRPGCVPTRVCNTIRRSMNGIRARTTGASTPPIHAVNTCSWMIPRVTWRL